MIKQKSKSYVEHNYFSKRKQTHQVLKNISCKVERSVFFWGGGGAVFPTTSVLLLSQVTPKLCPKYEFLIPLYFMGARSLVSPEHCFSTRGQLHKALTPKLIPQHNQKITDLSMFNFK